MAADLGKLLEVSLSIAGTTIVRRWWKKAQAHLLCVGCHRSRLADGGEAVGQPTASAVVSGSIADAALGLEGPPASEDKILRRQVRRGGGNGEWATSGVGRT